MTIKIGRLSVFEQQCSNMVGPTDHSSSKVRSNVIGPADQASSDPMNLNGLRRVRNILPVPNNKLLFVFVLFFELGIVWKMNDVSLITKNKLQRPCLDKFSVPDFRILSTG